LRGLSQNKNFGKLMGNYSQIDIGEDGNPNIIQYQHSSVGPISYLSFGLGHELRIDGEEMEEIISKIPLNPYCLTVVFFNSLVVSDLRGAVTNEALQLIQDLRTESLPRKNRMRAIRSAERKGVVVFEAVLSDLPPCIDLALDFSKRKHLGNPWGEISKLIGTEFAKLLVAKRDGRCIGFLFLLMDNDLRKGYAKHGAWGPEGVSCNVPSLLIYEAIRHCREAGLDYFDFFGFSYSNNRSRGIANFKMSFGGELRPYFRTKIILFMGRRMSALMKAGVIATSLDIWPISSIAQILHSRLSE